MSERHAAVCKEDLTFKVNPKATGKTMYFYLKKVLTNKGKVIAFVCLYKRAYYPNNVMGIDWIVVDPKYSRQGIGTGLARWAIAEARRRGKSIVISWSVKKAIPFHTKLGFRRSHMLPKEENFDLTLMVKKI